MKLGEIYLWETEKVEGYSRRRKYHVFICDDEEGHTFLFIKARAYPGGIGGAFGVALTCIRNSLTPARAHRRYDPQDQLGMENPV